MPVSRDEIADVIYESSEDFASKAAARRAVKAVFEKIAENMEEGETVVIPGFGKFFTKDRKARMGRNPQTGDPVEIAANTVPAFKALGALKTRVGV